MAVVYCLLFPNHKCYVGRTSKSADLRFRKHVRDAKGGLDRLVSRAILKYGAENVKVLILSENLPWNEAAEAEKKWIVRLNSKAPGGYNLTVGGEGVLGLKRPGRRAWNKGLKMSDEYRRKLSEAHKGQVPWLKGRRHTQETIVKMSKAHRGPRGPYRRKSDDRSQ